MQYVHVTDICRVIGQIITEHGKEPMEVYGCTNYVDMRLGYMLKMMSDEGKTFTPNQRQALALTVYNFIHSLETDDNGKKSYYIPGSGTYVVTAPNLLDMILHYLQNNNDTKKTTFVERVHSWFSRWF